MRCADEPRRSSRVKDVADTKEALEAARAVAAAAEAEANAAKANAAKAGSAASERFAHAAAAAAASASAAAGPGPYEALAEPWSHASWDQVASPEAGGIRDAVGALKAELLALGSRTVRLAASEQTDGLSGGVGGSMDGEGKEATVAHTGRDVKHAASLWDLVGPAHRGGALSGGPPGVGQRS